MQRFVVHANIEDILRFPNAILVEDLFELSQDAKKIEKKGYRMNLVYEGPKEGIKDVKEKLQNVLGNPHLVKVG